MRLYLPRWPYRPPTSWLNVFRMHLSPRAVCCLAHPSRRARTLCVPSSSAKKKERKLTRQTNYKRRGGLGYRCSSLSRMHSGHFKTQRGNCRHLDTASCGWLIMWFRDLSQFEGCLSRRSWVERVYIAFSNRGPSSRPTGGPRMQMV